MLSGDSKRRCEGGPWGGSRSLAATATYLRLVAMRLDGMVSAVSVALIVCVLEDGIVLLDNRLECLQKKGRASAIILALGPLLTY